MSKSLKKYHYIYKTTCIVSKRYYIGMHTTDNLNDEYLGSGKRLWNSINYHGKENHKKEILEFCSNREELKQKEKEIVNNILLSDKYCMNLQPGGGGGFINENHMMKTSKAGNEKFKKNMEDPEYRKKFSKKMSEAYKKSDDLGKREKKQFYDWTGKNHSEETKLKLSLKNKNKGVGIDNSVWGRKWMNKDFKNKMVKQEEIEFHISDGWVFGIHLEEKKKLTLKEQFEKIRHLSGPSCVGRKWINKNGKNKRVINEDLDKYLNDGWVLGCLIKRPI
jgi:hypothetical protein